MVASPQSEQNQISSTLQTKHMHQDYHTKHIMQQPWTISNFDPNSFISNTHNAGDTNRFQESYNHLVRKHVLHK
jgi:hypothetical protein|uniref:Uncharacterized protein n=1 Tax=Populus trichocarpa TaxID=3694 RepID=A0A2K2BI63_POPTR